MARESGRFHARGLALALSLASGLSLAHVHGSARAATQLAFEIDPDPVRDPGRDPDLDCVLDIAREFEFKSFLAAGELVQLLEEDAGPGAAITEARQQITRWQAPSLRIQYVDLLGRHGHFGDAAAFIERTIPDDSLPAGVRQKLCAWYVAQQARQGRFADAAATARAGLAIGEDPGLAWALIMVLVNDGKLHDARQALARYSPGPGTDQEIRVWMQLHLGVPVTASSARVMIGLVRRQPDGEFRDAIIAMLLREAVLAEKTGSFPADVTEAVGRLEEETRDRPGTGLRISPDDDALRAALEKQQPDQAAYRKLLTAVQDGTAGMADIGRASPGVPTARSCSTARPAYFRRAISRRACAQPASRLPGVPSRRVPAPRTCRPCTCWACSAAATGCGSARPCPARSWPARPWMTPC